MSLLQRVTEEQIPLVSGSRTAGCVLKEEESRVEGEDGEEEE